MNIQFIDSKTACEEKSSIYILLLKVLINMLTINPESIHPYHTLKQKKSGGQEGELFMHLFIHVSCVHYKHGKTHQGNKGHSSL